MNTEEMLNKLLKEALKNDDLRKKLVATENSKEPMEEFCAIATEAGFPIDIGEFFVMNQTFCDNLLKSTNGGATYPIDDWADAYEQFISAIK